MKIKIDNWKRIILVFLIMILTVESERDPLCLVLIGLILINFYESNRTLKTVSLSVAPLILIVEILSFWGLPFQPWLIWFWGVPFVLIAVLLAVIGKNIRYSIPVILSIFLGTLIIINQFVLFSKTKSVELIRSETTEEGCSHNLIKNISQNAILSDSYSAINKIKTEVGQPKRVIMAPYAPNLNAFLSNENPKGEFWIFGEHDNLGDFLTPGSLFNNDSYQRKPPWHAYRPQMSRTLQIASDLDPLYASNLGCTIKSTPLGYALIWEYTKFGIPNILALGTFNWMSRLTYIGDSDPIVKFLASYNPHFLHSLMNYPNATEIFKGLLLLICALSIRLWTKWKGILILVIGGFLISFLPQYYPYYSRDPVDVSIINNNVWYSPHVETHYSSLPKSLSQKDLTVSINDPGRESKLSILIIDSGLHLFSHRTKYNGIKNLILMTPNASIKIGNDYFRIEDIPLGKVEREIYAQNITIPDARRIIVNNSISDCALIINDIYLIGTNSPQLIEGLESII